MSTELRDLRAKITVETDCVLDSIARGTGRERSEIVREWLHQKALEYMAVQKILNKRMAAEGITGQDGE
jgi:hypothetical protein